VRAFEQKPAGAHTCLLLFLAREESEFDGGLSDLDFQDPVLDFDDCDFQLVHREFERLFQRLRVDFLILAVHENQLLLFVAHPRHEEGPSAGAEVAHTQYSTPVKGSRNPFRINRLARFAMESAHIRGNALSSSMTQYYVIIHYKCIEYYRNMT